MSNAQVLFHSSIRIEGEKILYFDPYKLGAPRGDADVIYITHDHFDHYSEEDIRKILKPGTLIVVPTCLEARAKALAPNNKVLSLKPGRVFLANGIKSESVAAYNIGKKFHPKENGWLGYIVTVGGTRYYIAGDTSRNEDNENVKCDVALVPIDGTYTMDPYEAADLVNHIKPKKAIPTHYGEIAGKTENAVTFKNNVDEGIEVEIQLYS